MMHRNGGDNRGKRGDRATEKFRKLFIGGLTSNVDDDALKAHFEQWGEVVDVVVMRDKNTGRSRNFGFVTYPDESCVDAVQAARPHQLDGREVETKRAIPRDTENPAESNQNSVKLFVGGLRPDVTEDQLRDCFGQFGDIDKAELATWKDTGKPRGFAFITFFDYDAVDKAIIHKPHQIGSCQADCKKAMSKEDMAKIQSKQQQQQGYGGGYGGNAGGYGQQPDYTMYNQNYGAGGYGGATGYGSAPGYGGAPGYDNGGYQDSYGGSSGYASASGYQDNFAGGNFGYEQQGFGNYGQQENFGGGVMKQGGFGAGAGGQRPAPYSGGSGGRGGRGRGGGGGGRGRGRGGRGQ